MEASLQKAAEDFCASLTQDQTVRAFYSARETYDQDDEIYRLRMEYTQLVHDLRQRQDQGALTEEDVEGLRALEEKINDHEHTQALSRAQAGLAEALEKCNVQISEVLGFDYASSAAAPKSCGC